MASCDYDCLFVVGRVMIGSRSGRAGGKSCIATFRVVILVGKLGPCRGEKMHCNISGRHSCREVGALQGGKDALPHFGSSFSSGPAQPASQPASQLQPSPQSSPQPTPQPTPQCSPRCRCLPRATWPNGPLTPSPCPPRQVTCRLSKGGTWLVCL